MLRLPEKSYIVLVRHFDTDKCLDGPKTLVKSLRCESNCVQGKKMSEKSPPPDDINKISDKLLSDHMQRLNKDFATIFAPRKHNPITSNAEDWIKKDKPNG